MVVESKFNVNLFYIVYLFDIVKIICFILYYNEMEKKDSIFIVYKKN